MKRFTRCAFAEFGVLVLSAFVALGQGRPQTAGADDANRADRSARRTSASLATSDAEISSRKGAAAVTPMASGPNLPVAGSGTIGRLPKWTGLNSSNSFIGDSIIFESKNAQVGIGTDTPTSKLTVQGMVETTLGGYKFPDGTIQTTAATSFQSIFHDVTLTGDGTQGSPLGIAVPLSLSGSIPNYLPGILTVTNTGQAGAALRAFGGDSDVDLFPGPGLLAGGGDSTGAGQIDGGAGVMGFGGRSQNFRGGPGVFASGGDVALGTPGPGGAGVDAMGGGAIFAGGSASGGDGVVTMGGVGRGAGFHGGAGIIAYSGPAYDGAAGGVAGIFNGDVEVGGNFNVLGGTKNFKIDHPLDPENKFLYHAAIESSEVLNIYSGNITTDDNGDAVVNLPNWFEAINRDFRYQLTVVGAFAQAIIADEIKSDSFRIKTSLPNVKVSWQVTGIRSDAVMRKHPFRVEEDKQQAERGFYLVPEAYDQPEERGIEWARNPQLMHRRKQERSSQTHDQARPSLINR